MDNNLLTLSILPDTFAICRLDASSKLPQWAITGNFISITRTVDELSIVCPANQVPPGTNCNSGWQCFKVEGKLDFSLTGILAALATPLAQAGISIFAVSTYDTDYLLVKAEDKENAILILTAAGHMVQPFHSFISD